MTTPLIPVEARGRTIGYVRRVGTGFALFDPNRQPIAVYASQREGLDVLLVLAGLPKVDPKQRPKRRT